MNKTGVLVANGSRARFLHLQGKNSHQSFETVAEFTHEESRMKGRDLVTDRPGHYHANSHARGAYGEDRNPKDITKEQFALELAKHLDTYRSKDGYNKLLLVTPAQFSGMLEKHLGKATADKVTDTVHKDYTSWTDKELLAVLHEQLKPEIK